MIATARIAEISKASNGYSEAVVVPGVFGADFISQADVAGILRQVSSDVGNLGKVLAKMDQLKGVLEVRRYKK